MRRDRLKMLASKCLPAELLRLNSSRHNQNRLNCIVFNLIVFNLIVFNLIVFNLIVFNCIVFNCIVFNCIVFNCIVFNLAPDFKARQAPFTFMSTFSKKAPNAKANVQSEFDSLFGTRQGERSISGLRLLDRTRVTVQPQARSRFSNDDIEELAASIRELQASGQGIEGTGILQPLLVRAAPDGSYILIAGERRLRAAERAGVPQVPVVATTTDAGATLLLQLIENTQREGFHPLDEARAVEQLMREQKLSIREAARALGKHRRYVENRLNLLKTGSDVQNMVSLRSDSLTHATLIDAVADHALRHDLIAAVLEDGASERDIRRRIEAASEAASSDANAIETVELSLRRDSHGAADPTETSSTEAAPSVTSSKTSAKRDHELSLRRDSSAQINSATAPDNRQAESENRDADPDADPLENALRPAVAFAAEAARGLRGVHLSFSYRSQVRHELALLRKQIEVMERLL